MSADPIEAEGYASWDSVRVVVFDFFRTLGMWRAGTVGSPAEVLYQLAPDRKAIDTRRLVALVEGGLGSEQFPYRPHVDEYRRWQYDAWAAAANYAGVHYDDALQIRLEQVLVQREIVLYPDVVDALDAVTASGMTWVLCSNASPDLAEKLHALLPKRLHPQAMVISCEVGARKPHRRMFAEVIDAAGFPPAQLAFIGDQLDCDVLGPYQHGLRPVLLDRGGEHDGEWPPRDGPLVPRWRSLEPLRALAPGVPQQA
ncbi:HAD family hydrolase [Nocardia asiatica]|uniref:HAD family hydrolase n=1 Tax=Nocardia asiatica TaxID=209252 RepID=UPI00245450DF|nr:HAD family hydrolase [Nocardia asiatica]